MTVALPRYSVVRYSDKDASARSGVRQMLAVCAALCLWLIGLNASEAANYVSHSMENGKLVIVTDEGNVQVSAFADAAIEVHYQLANGSPLPSFALKEDAVVSAVELESHPEFLSLNAGKINAVISKFPLHFSFYQNGQLLIEEESGWYRYDDISGFRFKLQDDEKLLGGGERILGMDRRGQAFPLYNRAHYGYTNESNQMYCGLPAVMSSRHYSLIFDNSASGYMDLGRSQSDVLQFGAVGGRTAYIVIAGESYPQLINNMVNVTGKQPLPPRWAWGNFASRFGYRTEQQTRDTVQQFIDEGFPLDAVVLDLYWFGKDIKGHMGNLSWDKEAFPKPKTMMADFKHLGVKTILITEPFVLSSSKRWQEALDNQALAKGPDGEVKQFEFYFGNTGLIDVFKPQARQWFSGIYGKLHEQGVAGWWGDLGEPEVHPADTLHEFGDISVSADEIHNVYGHMWAKLVYDNQRAIAPKQRPFIMMRSGFIGSQRYGILPWTGDVKRAWDGLKPQVELSLQMGLMGLGYTHSDLGGFADGESFDQEMYIRWLQYGVFQPVFRPHGQEHIAPEPIFHDGETKDILRQFIKLRYAMLPYNYSLSFENSLSGMPLMRPMFFEDESQPQLMDINDQYLWGKALLVKPVTEPGLEQISVSLPAGRWFDFWSDTDYDGQQTIQLAVEPDRIPVMVRAGSFLPMVQPVRSTDDYHTEQLDLHYYSDASVAQASGVMYDDDGHSANSIANAEFETLSFNAKQQDSQLQINLNRQGKYKGMPKVREMRLVVHNWLKPPLQAQKDIKKLLANTLEEGQVLNESGSEIISVAPALKAPPLVVVASESPTLKPAPISVSLPLVADLPTLDQSKVAMFWEEHTNTLYLKFNWQHNVQITIKQ